MSGRESIPVPKVQMKRDEHGRWAQDAPKTETTPTTEAAERPPMPDAGARYFAQRGSDEAG